MTADEKIAKARVHLVLYHPFFASLTLRLIMKEKPLEWFIAMGAPCATMCTDGTHIYWYRKYVDDIPFNEVVATLMHEDLHPGFLHHIRMGNRNALKWNFATDLAINPLVEAGMRVHESSFSLPKGWLYDKKYLDKSAEEIYSLLPDPPKDKQPKWNIGAFLPPTKPNGEPFTESEVKQIEHDWKIAIAQAAHEAKRQGKLPAGMERFVDQILEPVVDWKDVLHRFAQQCLSKDDYTWRQPSRRHLYRGLYLPSIQMGEQLPPIVVGVDTSGSIGQEELSQFAGEITDILEKFDTTALVIYCDAAVANVEEFTKDDLPLQLHPKGGGGTDFSPVFDYVKGKQITPACLIYLTDMAGTFPDEAPEYPVLWAHIGNWASTPPFGEIVKVEVT